MLEGVLCVQSMVHHMLDGCVDAKIGGLKVARIAIDTEAGLNLIPGNSFHT